MGVFDATGVHIEYGRSLVLLGAEGAQTIRAVMRSLRAEPMRFIGSEPVTGRQDFLVDGTTGPLTEGEKSSRDVLELSSEHYRVVIRSSGTEAKLKYYFDYRERPGAAGPGPANTAAERYRLAEPAVWADCTAVYADLARRAGFELSPAALELPDVLPMQEKAALATTRRFSQPQADRIQPDGSRNPSRTGGQAAWMSARVSPPPTPTWSTSLPSSPRTSPSTPIRPTRPSR